MITNLSPAGPLAPLYFMRCTGASIGADGTLSLTFGPWTITSEDAAWRVLKGATILAGRGDGAALSPVLDAALTGVGLRAVETPSSLDARLILTTPFTVETFAIRPDTRSALAIRRDGQLLFDYAVDPAWAIASHQGHAVGHA